MAGKNRDFGALADALKGASVASNYEPKPGPKPQAETKQISLRVSVDLLNKLRVLAAEASGRELRTVSIQELILGVVEKEFGGDHG